MEFPRSKVFRLVACLCEFRFARYVEFANCFRVRPHVNEKRAPIGVDIPKGKRRILFTDNGRVSGKKNGRFVFDSFQLGTRNITRCLFIQPITIDILCIKHMKHSRHLHRFHF